jgi:DNA replication protein DnaC
MTPPFLKPSRSDPDAPIDPRDGGPDCAYCGNKRFVVDAQGNLKPCEHCNIAQQWKVNSVRAFSSRAGVAARQTFMNFRTRFGDEISETLTDCLEAAEAFAMDPYGRWLVIWGERGSGKSHLCAAVDNHLMQSGVPSLFVTMPDLLASLRQAMDLQTNTEQESYSGRMSVFKTAPVLILDDLGAESGSPWSDGVLFEVLDYRYRNRLATMIATNVNPDDFDPRIASRMQDTEFCTVVEDAAPDYRRRSRSERK